MHHLFLLLPLALACGVASADIAGDKRPMAPKEPPRLNWQGVVDGLPPAADPSPIDWRASNQTVYRLNGHIGHWRGALQLPPIEPPMPAGEKRQ